MKKIVAICWGMLLLSSPGVAPAAELEPDALIKNTVQEVLAVIKQDKEIQSGSQRKVIELVDAKVLPHFDFTRMTQLAVGKNWRAATPEQKKALETEFRNLLVRTYTKALTVYRDQVVETKPVKMAPGATEVTVKTVIVKPGSQSIPVNYEMAKTADGWKVYDLAIEGVSLVTSYRGTFAEQIQQSGIDGLIKTLVEKNQKAASTGTTPKVPAK